MWYNIFLKGFLTSVYHSNNNCHNYHYDCHYCPYYHLTCHHHHQNVNYYAQINIHIKTPVLFKVPKQRKCHFLVIFTPILQDGICHKNFGIAEYVHFQTNVNFSTYLSARGFRKNWHISQNGHILRSQSFCDKCFLFNIFILLKKMKQNSFF